MRAGLGQDEAATALLAEVRTYPGARDTQDYIVMLPTMVRTALAIGEIAHAEALVGGLEARTPYAEYALVAAKAALSEAQGTCGPPPKPTLMRPIAGNDSESCPKRRSPSSARAGV